MQLKDQVKKSRDWKVAAALATVSALGISGLALADTGDPTNPDPIDLKDRTEITQVTSAPTLGSEFANLVLSADSPNDSPFDDTRSVSSVGADTAQSPITLDSEATADSPAISDTPVTTDSPAAADSPAGDSIDSTDNSADS
jgi:hypothetical protein